MGMNDQWKDSLVWRFASSERDNDTPQETPLVRHRHRRQTKLIPRSDTSSGKQLPSPRSEPEAFALVATAQGVSI